MQTTWAKKRFLGKKKRFFRPPKGKNFGHD
jgi:hypothetical protein